MGEMKKKSGIEVKDMDEMEKMVDEMEVKRADFLIEVYERSDGGESKIIDIYQIGEDLGFDKELTSNIVEYLKGAGLIKIHTIGGGIGITHKGVRQAEEYITGRGKSPL